MHPNRNQCHRFAGLPLLAVLAALVALTTASQSSAQQTTTSATGNGAKIGIKLVPIKVVPPNSGQQMYVAYCAVCHGDMAKGDGPAAPALQSRPTDLSMLAVNNGGKFPKHHVAYVLTVVEEPWVRGSAEMPSWCPAFRAIDQGYSPAVTLRVRNLISYLKTLQVQAPQELAARNNGGHQR